MSSSIDQDLHGCINAGAPVDPHGLSLLFVHLHYARDAKYLSLSFFFFFFFSLQGLKVLRLGARIGPFPNCISHQRDDETLITMRLETTSFHVQLSYVEPPKRRTLTLPHIGCQVEGCVSALADQSLIFRRQIAALPTASVRSTALPGEYDNLKSMFSDCKSPLHVEILNRSLLENKMIESK